MCLDFRILHNFNDMWKSTRSGAFLPICSFFRRSIRENPHRRMQIRLDVNFHGFCIRLRRSYLRDSPLSKDFEKRERSIFCKANILTVGAAIGRLLRLGLPLGEAVAVGD